MGKLEIIKSVQPLIDAAKKQECWLLCAPQQIIISPTQLQIDMANSCYLFGPKMWQLVKAAEVRKRYTEILATAQSKLDEFEKMQAENLKSIANGNLRIINNSGE